MPIVIKKNIENPYLFYEENNELIIKILGGINFKQWAQYYSELQNAILNSLMKKIHVDLTEAKDCVPVALVSLCLSLARKKISGCEMTIKLYKIYDEYGEKIYSQFVHMGIFCWCSEWGIKVIVDGNEICDIDKYSMENNRGDDILIPLMVIDARKIVNVYSYVRELMEERIGNFDCEDSIRYKIENILFETIDNIKKHAYIESEEAMAGVFVRRREGVWQQDEKNVKVFRELKQEYGNNYDGIDREYVRQKTDYFEIVVMDEGVGITSTLDVKNKDGDDTKYPFLQSFKRTVIEGERRKYINRAEKSYYSGLNLVFKLLGENSDYVYGKEKDLYVYTQCGRNVTNIPHRIYRGTNSEFMGLLWIFHVGRNDCRINDYYSYRPKLLKNQLLINVCKEKDYIEPNQFNDIYIWDDRKIAESTNNLFYKQNLVEDPNEFVWFIEGHYGKNNAFNEISKKMVAIHKDNAALLILNVPDSDMVVFYHAILHSSIGGEKCKKIIVVSKTLRIAIYEREKEGKFYHKEELAKKFYTDTKQSSIEGTVVQLYRFMRKYDSSIWWSKVLTGTNKEYLIKRGHINWESFVLKYYVNLEMMLEEHDLYELVQDNLERVKAFVNNFAEFKNTDILMKRTCIEANYRQERGAEKESRIYVESVYVSGKTDQIINLKENDVKICLFQNDFFLQESIDVNRVEHLFVWPTEQVIDSFVEQESNVLERKRNTHTVQIERNSNASDKIISKKNEIIYDKKYYETLNDMLYMYEGFIKLGHFSYHSNHDIFSFNVTNIIKKNFYEKNGAFLRVLVKFINCLGVKAYNLLKSEWKIAIGKLDNLPNDSGVIVYRSHYYTDFILKMIYECFEVSDGEIWNSILPLDSIEERSYMNPFTISDIQYQYIQGVLLNKRVNNDCKVLFFDTMISSGKTSREIQNIFESIAKSVNIDLRIEYMYLFDCETLQYKRNTDVHFEAYYRIDIPRMGRKKSCLFCRYVDNVSQYYNIFISDLAKKRILKWAEIWRPISPLFTDYNHGFINSKIESPNMILGNLGIQMEIGYMDFYTLAAQLVEIAYTNRDEEFLSKICSESNNQLTIEQKIQLLEIQLLSFDTEDNYRLHYTIMHKMIKYMNQFEKATNATALAAMLIISCDKDIVYHIFKEIDNSDDCLKNEDILIAFAILCYRDEELQDTRLYQDVNSMLEYKKYDIDLLKELHSQIYNVHGTWHGTSFEHLLKPYGNAEKLLNGCNSAYNSLSYINSIISRINPLAIDSERVCKMGTDILMDNVKGSIDKLFQRFEEIRKEIHDDWRTLPEDYKDELQKTVRMLKDFHATLFIPFGKEKKQCGKPLIERVEKILIDVGEKYQSDMEKQSYEPELKRVKAEGMYPFWDKEEKRICTICVEQCSNMIDTKKEEIWYVWDRRMEEEFKYLITDLRHSSGAISHRSFGDVNMVISFEFNEKSAKIILNSISKIDHKEIMKRVEEKSRYQREIIQRNGATIRYTSQKKGEQYYLTTFLELEAIC